MSESREICSKEGGESPSTGVVVRVDAHACLVDLGSRVVRCGFRGRLFEDRRKRRRRSKPVVVGDRVTVQVLSEEEGALEEVLPRRTKLSRKASDKDGVEQVVVANVDLLAIVASLKDPPLRSRLVDRFLVAGAAGGLDVVLCLNKIDLCAEGDSLLRDAEDLYRGLGLTVLPTSAADGRGLEELRAALTGRISVFCGPSGAGKSTLLNRIAPGLQLRTRGVGMKTRKGRHTTTAVSLYKIPGLGHLVDTPGIRGLGIWDVGPEELDGFFPEVFELSSGCRFRGCSHSHEPSCAVKAAVESGDLHPHRYESYLRIRVSLEEDGAR